MTAINKMPPVCTAKNRPLMVARNRDLMLAVLFRPRCKSWQCPACAEINKNLWTVRAYGGAHFLMGQGQELFFITLTSHEKLTPDQTLWTWPRAWAKLRDRMRYENNGTFHYLMVPERHKSGRLHVHAVESSGLGSRWFKDNARECGMGFQAKEEKITSPVGAAVYTVKYLAKSITETNWPRGFRRVRASRSWPKLPRMNDLDWSFQVLPTSEGSQGEVERLESAGYAVECLNHLAAWEFIERGGEWYGEVED